MNINDVLQEAFNRVSFSLYWKEKEKEKHINVLQEYTQGGVSPSGYSNEVCYAEFEEGEEKEIICAMTYHSREKQKEQITGDVYPLVEVSDLGLSVVLKKLDYRKKVGYHSEDVLLGVKRICMLTTIRKVEFSTTSGWHAECYPERKENYREPEPRSGVLPKRYLYQNLGEDEWIIILHRSTGAVSIHRETSSLPWN